MLVLEMYRHAGTWVFTDEKEVLLMSLLCLECLKFLTQCSKNKILKGKSRYRVVFSDQNFPLAHAEVKKISEEGGGAWYENKKPLRVGFVQQLFKFFKKFQKNFFRIE